MMKKTQRMVIVCSVQMLFFSAALTTGLCNPQLTSFDLVWETVNNTHFDATFGGVDWKAMHKRYRAQIRLSEGIDDFSRITNEMLFELRLSHLLVASDDMLKTYMPKLFAEGTIGVDVRWMGHQAVISRVNAGSAAQGAGLRTGYVITQIDGRDITDLVRSGIVMPPFNHRNYRGGLSNYIAGHLDGPPDTSVSIVFKDGKNREFKATMVRQSRGAGKVLNDAMPPVFIEFESRRLEGDIGYVRFNHFAAPVDTAFVEALASLRDTRGLIFDIRGNPGGYFRVMDTLIEQLISRETPPYQFKMRHRIIHRTLHPTHHPYIKPVAVLIDATSTSCSEQFAASLQALGRAVIVGERSPGYLLGANWLRLPNGLSFMHTILQPFPFDGRIVEGRGVVPDLSIVPAWEDLRDDKDPQLEAAIAHILAIDASGQ